MSDIRDGVQRKPCWQLEGCCVPTQGVVRASLQMKTVVEWCVWEDVAMFFVGFVYKGII